MINVLKPAFVRSRRMEIGSLLLRRDVAKLFCTFSKRTNFISASENIATFDISAIAIGNGRPE